MRIARSFGLFGAAALCAVFSAFAGEVLITPDEAALEKWGVAGFYRTAESEPEVRVEGSTAFQIPTNGGPVTVFSQGGADVKLEQNVEMAGVTFVARPRKLRYSLSLAQVRSFELEFASGPITNSLRSHSGLRFGLGVAGSFVPVTTAGAGIGWSVDYRRFTVNLDRFESAGTVTPADQRIEQDEIQGSVITSFRWKSVSPYGGLKLQRVITRLRDRTTKESLRGEVDGISPVVGVEWMPLPGEGLAVEGSFIDDESLTVSWIAKF